MKRKRDTEHREEVLISSDSEDEQQAETSKDDWDEDDEDVDEDDDEDDDADADADASADEDDDDDDYEEGEDEEIVSLSSDSEGVPYSKARKKAFSGVDGNNDAETAQQGRRKHKQKLKKGSRQAIRGTISSGEDRKLFADALNIIRGGGDLEKLSLEHCRSYLRHYSLRLTGSKSVLFDRVQEHIELKACGGMAKYPRSTFTINCTGDACTGDIVLFKQKVYKNYNKACRGSTLPPIGKRVVAGRIVKESYGSDKQQHTFTVEVLWSRGPKSLPLLYPLLIKGRNLYRLKTFRQRWANEEERKRVLQEKHSRGSLARNARDDRVSGKRPSRSNQRQHPDGRAKVTLKRENTSKVKPFQVDAAPSKANFSRGNKETAFRERSMNSMVVFSHREHENTYCERVRTTKCILDIKASFAGILIGSQGRHIGAISRASGAKLQILENPLNPTLRLVEIIGVPEQVQRATGMVVQSFLDKGLPPPVVTRQSSGFAGQGW